MCTAVTLLTDRHYFGRNLDLEASYDERVVVCPRRFPLSFRHLPAMPEHHALIGMAHIEDGCPLFYDAANEHGLAIAGLNFPEFCVYHAASRDADNVAPFELIPWILGQCASLGEARALLERVNLCDTPFSSTLPLTPLHFMLADRSGCLVLESRSTGLQIYDNPAKVMTNSPPFDFHLQRLRDFMNLSRGPAQSRFSDYLPMEAYSRGMGAMGLPGDLSSSSRFVRAAFASLNSECAKDEVASVSQFFHILDFAAFPRGCVKLGENAYEITVYSCCINADTGIYYYKTYENSRITAVDMHRENLVSDQLIAYPLASSPQILIQNA